MCLGRREASQAVEPLVKFQERIVPTLERYQQWFVLLSWKQDGLQVISAKAG